MTKFSMLVSVVTLILGFTFFGEDFTFNIHDTYYVIAAEALFFSIWLIIIIFIQLIRLKKYLSGNAA